MKANKRTPVIIYLLLLIASTSLAVSLSFIVKNQAALWPYVIFSFLVLFVSSVFIVKIINSLVNEVQGLTTKFDLQVEALELAKIDAQASLYVKNRFLANMNHELRTPLTSIIGFSELAQECSKVSEKDDLLKKVEHSGLHLLGLISDILDLIKIEEGRCETESESVDFFSLLCELNHLSEIKAGEKGLDYQCTIHYPIPRTILSDAARLQQILSNLISNAVKFTKEGDVSLEVSYCAETHVVRIDINDSGLGMTLEQQEALYRSFSQEDISASREFGGVGLGLSISKALTVLLGGTLTVSSVVGKGSCFSLSLDCGDAELELLGASPALSQQEKTVDNNLGTSVFEKTMSILVAEDDLQSQELVQLLLKKLNTVVTIVENGKEAVEAAMVTDFDLILMDMQMPIMGGLKAVELLRGSGYAGCIIALTANVMTEDISSYSEAGCDDCIAKPIDRAVFYRTLGVHAQKMVDDRKEAELDDDMSQDPAFLAIVDKFQQDLMARIDIMSAALDVSDFSVLTREAHSLKGTAGALGFPELTQPAAILEDLARKKSSKECAVALSELKTICSAVNEESD